MWKTQTILGLSMNYIRPSSVSLFILDVYAGLKACFNASTYLFGGGLNYASYFIV